MKLHYQVASPEVRIGFGTTSLMGDMNESFKLLAATGYAGAEIMVRDPKQVDFGDIERLAAAHRLEIPMICTGEVYGQDRVTFSDPDEAVRDEAIARVRAAIDGAARFGAFVNIGRVRGGYLPHTPREWTERVIDDAVRALVEHAATRGVTIALEPVNSLFGNFINSSAEGMEYVRRIRHPNFRIMLDTTHMFIEDRSIPDAVAATGGDITLVHLSESNRKYPGSCKFNFAELFRALRDVGYAGDFSVEIFQWPDPETAVRESIRFLSQLLDQ